MPESRSPNSLSATKCPRSLPAPHPGSSQLCCSAWCSEAWAWGAGVGRGHSLGPQAHDLSCWGGEGAEHCGVPLLLTWPTVFRDPAPVRPVGRKPRHDMAPAQLCPPGCQFRTHPTPRSRQAPQHGSWRRGQEPACSPGVNGLSAHLPHQRGVLRPRSGHGGSSV